MTDYDDLFMRDFVGDTGSIPSTTRVSVSNSPDIIPAGSNPVSNYKTVYANNYSGPFNYYQNVQQNVPNYIYVRAYNLSKTSARSGTIALYYAPSSLLLTPSQWIGNVIQNANGTNAANIPSTAALTAVVGDSPFYWQPATLDPSKGHYCLVAQVVTTEDPNPIPSGDNLKDFAIWVASKPGIAWRNVTVVSTLPAPSFSGFQGFANTHGSPTGCTFSVTCTDIPDNTAVSLVCPTTGPIPQVNLTQTVGPANQTGTNPKTNVFGTFATLPANFSSVVQLTATLPSGVSPPEDADITVSFFLATTLTDDVRDIAIEPERAGVTREQIAEAGGVLLLLGDYTYEFRIGS